MQHQPGPNRWRRRTKREILKRQSAPRTSQRLLFTLVLFFFRRRRVLQCIPLGIIYYHLDARDFFQVKFLSKERFFLQKSQKKKRQTEESKTSASAKKKKSEPKKDEDTHWPEVFHDAEEFEWDDLKWFTIIGYKNCHFSLVTMFTFLLFFWPKNPHNDDTQLAS